MVPERESGEAQISSLAAFPLVIGVGDGTQALRVMIPVTAGGATAPATVDLVVVVVCDGRSFTTLTFGGLVELTAVETIDEIDAAADSSLPS
ncbi:MAG: spore coat protein U-like protein [Candidatus Aldehydirespiratoraceae bacterium]